MKRVLPPCPNCRLDGGHYVAVDDCYPLWAKAAGPGFQIACRFCSSLTDAATSRKRAAANWRKGRVIPPFHQAKLAFQQAKLDRLNDEIDRLNHEIDRLNDEIDEQMPTYARALARGRMSRRLMTICRCRKQPKGWFPLPSFLIAFLFDA